MSTEHELVLMKMAMGRFPAVDVVVPGKLMFDVIANSFEDKSAISYLVESDVKPEAADPKNAIYIADLDNSHNTHIDLLLVRGDPGRSIPGFVNPVDRVVRPAQNDDPNFVPGASCHLVISKQEIAAGTDTGRFRAAMEKTRGIGRALVRDFLSQLLARYAEAHADEFVAKKKKKTKKEKAETISYRPTVKFHPHENGSLRKDLEDGRIGGFKLTRGSTEFKGAANEASLQKLDVKLQARIVPTNDFSRVKRLVDHVQQTLDAISFEKLNLELVDEGGEPMESTHAISLDRLENPDLRYCKVVPIPNLGDDVLECYGKFYNPIKNYAVRVATHNEYWT